MLIPSTGSTRFLIFPDSPLAVCGNQFKQIGVKFWWLLGHFIVTQLILRVMLYRQNDFGKCRKLQVHSGFVGGKDPA